LYISAASRPHLGRISCIRRIHSSGGSGAASFAPPRPLEAGEALAVAAETRPACGRECAVKCALEMPRR